MPDIPEGGEPRAVGPLDVEIQCHEHAREPPKDLRRCADREPTTGQHEEDEEMRIPGVYEIAQMIAQEEPAWINPKHVGGEPVAHELGVVRS